MNSKTTMRSAMAGSGAPAMLGLVFVACFSDTDATHVAGNRQLNTLSSAEWELLCEAHERGDYGLTEAEAVELSCRERTIVELAAAPAGADASGQAAACQVLVDECLEHPLEPTGTCEARRLDSCPATVEEVERCLAARARERIERLTCERIGAGTAEDPQWVGTALELPECEALVSECEQPSVVEGPDTPVEGITGELDGALAFTDPIQGWATTSDVSDQRFAIGRTVGDDGYVWLRGFGDLASREPLRTEAMLLAPSSWPHAGEYLCMGSATARGVADGAVEVSLGDISSLGRCPMAGGTGTLSVTAIHSYATPLLPDDPAAMLEGSAVLELDGETLMGAANVSGWMDDLQVTLGARPGFVYFATESDAPSTQPPPPGGSLPIGSDPLPVERAALVLWPFDGMSFALSCLGEGSTVALMENDSGVRILTLDGQGLSPLSDCPGEPVAGSLEARFEGLLVGGAGPGAPAAGVPGTATPEP